MIIPFTALLSFASALHRSQVCPTRRSVTFTSPPPVAVPLLHVINPLGPKTYTLLLHLNRSIRARCGSAQAISIRNSTVESLRAPLHLRYRRFASTDTPKHSICAIVDPSLTDTQEFKGRTTNKKSSSKHLLLGDRGNGVSCVGLIGASWLLQNRAGYFVDDKGVEQSITSTVSVTVEEN